MGKSAQVQYLIEVKSELDKLQKQMGGVNKKLDETGRQAQKSGKGMQAFGKYFKGAILGAVAAIGAREVIGFLNDAIQGASAVAEATSKVGVVFEEASDKVLEFADNAATSIGQSERAALEATGVFGNLLTAVGMTEEASADMSIQMVTLASDMASFNDASPEEVLNALRAGLVGEAEPLKRFGVNLNEATMKQKALDMGLIESASGTLPAAIKAQAAYAVILEQTAKAQGDFARTADGLANKQRTLNALWEDTKNEGGEALIDPYLSVLTPIANVLSAYNDLEAAERSKLHQQNLATAAMSPHTAIMQQLAVVTELYNRGASKSAAVNAAAAGSTYELATAQGRSFAIADKLARARDRVTDATARLEDKERDATEAERDMIAVKLDITKKEEDLTAAIKEHGKGSDEARLATLELEIAQGELNDRTAEYDDKMADVAEAHNLLVRDGATAAKIAALRDLWASASVKVNAYQSAARLAIGRGAIQGGGGPDRHSGGPVPKTGSYSLMAGEHVLTPQQYAEHNNAVNINVVVNAQTGASAPDIGRSVRDELAAILRSANVRKVMMGA